MSCCTRRLEVWLAASAFSTFLWDSAFSIRGPCPPVCPLLPIRKPILCYVTDRRSLAGPPDAFQSLLLEKIDEAVRRNVDWIQLREKDLSGRELAAFSEQAVERTGEATRVLINDRLDVAFTVNAAG